MIITLKDGSKKEYDQAMSVYDIARDISDGLARAACLGEVDGETVDLRTIVDKDATVNILTFDSDEGKKAYRHTCSHVLAEAVKNLYPEAKLAIGPSIDTSRRATGWSASPCPEKMPSPCIRKRTSLTRSS